MTSPGIVFVGAVTEARPALTALLTSPLAKVGLVVTPDPGFRWSGAVDLGPLAASAGVPVRRTNDVNHPDTVAAIRAVDPALLVVCGWTRLLHEEVLGVPRHGCVGFHASLLPRHRGRAPVNWAILQGDSFTGNTMMLLSPGVDTGDIVDQRRIEIAPEDTCATIYDRVAEAGADMLLTQLPALLAGTAPRRRQDPEAGDLLPRRTPEMGVIDWDQPPRQVHDWVRALTAPYPGAFTTDARGPVMVWRTRPPDEDRTALPAGGTPPGTIVHIGDGGVQVATRGGSILVTQLSAPGQQPRAAEEFARMRGLVAGHNFDPVSSAVSRWAHGQGLQPEGLPDWRAELLGGAA